MAALRTRTSLGILSAASRANHRPVLVCKRFTTSDSSVQDTPESNPFAAQGPPPSDTSAVHEEGAARALISHHQPNYHAPVDQATSQFSPIPRAIMDGSEEGNVLPAAVLSGAPVELQARTVRIFRPSKTACQSGNWHAHEWRMDWDVLGKGHRWENFLMGWQSTADFMHATHLNFKSKEDAIHFAEKQGYEYFVQEYNERKFVPKAYANNFVHYPKKLKIVRTK